MTMKKKAGPPAADPRVVSVTAASPEHTAATMAQTIIQPTVQAAVTLFDLSKVDGTDVSALRDELAAQVKRVTGGDLKRAEAMLTAQAHTLDALFNNLTRSALASQMLNQYETNFRLALRAQAQCRTTLETLSAIKNPPVIFAKQANIANGPQQVNNGAAPLAHTEEKENPPNKLVQVTHEQGQRLDFGAETTAGAAHPAMAAVDTIQRPQNVGR